MRFIIKITHPIILFDGVCGLCNTAVDTIIRLDKNHHLKFSPLQSEAGSFLLEEFGINPAITDSIIFIEDRKAYTYSTAILKIAVHLGPVGKLASCALVIPAFLRDPFYKIIARYRYKWFGKKESCRIPSPQERAQFLENKNELF